MHARICAYVLSVHWHVLMCIFTHLPAADPSHSLPFPRNLFILNGTPARPISSLPKSNLLLLLISLQQLLSHISTPLLASAHICSCLSPLLTAIFSHVTSPLLTSRHPTLDSSHLSPPTVPILGILLSRSSFLNYSFTSTLSHPQASVVSTLLHPLKLNTLDPPNPPTKSNYMNAIVYNIYMILFWHHLCKIMMTSLGLQISPQD